MGQVLRFIQGSRMGWFSTLRDSINSVKRIGKRHKNKERRKERKLKKEKKKNLD